MVFIICRSLIWFLHIFKNIELWITFFSHSLVVKGRTCGHIIGFCKIPTIKVTVQRSFLNHMCKRTLNFYMMGLSLSPCISIYLSIYLSINQSIYLSIYLSIYPSPFLLLLSPLHQDFIWPGMRSPPSSPGWLPPSTRSATSAPSSLSPTSAPGGTYPSSSASGSSWWA